MILDYQLINTLEIYQCTSIKMKNKNKTILLFNYFKLFFNCSRNKSLNNLFLTKLKN